METPGKAVPPRVLAIHCSEAAFFEPFTRIIEGRPGGDTAERFSVPGGPWWVARAAGATEGKLRRLLAGNLSPVHDAIRSFLGERELGEVVLIGHQDCSWYRRVDARASAGVQVRRQGEDIYRATEEIRRLAPQALRVSAFMVLVTPEGLETRQLFG